MSWLKQSILGFGAVAALGMGLGFEAADAEIPAPCADVLDAPLGAAAFTEPLDLNEKFERVQQWANALAPRFGTRPFLSIVVPAFREEARLPGSIQKIKAFFDRFPISVEVLAIIEKSPDNTLAAAQNAADNDPRIQVIDNVVQRGKGYAVRSGVLRAQGEIILFMDADLSTPLYEIINFLDWMRTHPETDVLIGDRVQAIAATEGSRNAFRKMLSKPFNILVQALSPLDFPDTQAGFKAFRRSAAQRIFQNQQLDHFAFDVEVLILARELQFQAEARDIHWIDDRRSTVRPFIDPLKMLKDIIKVQFLVRQRLVTNEGRI